MEEKIHNYGVDDGGFANGLMNHSGRLEYHIVDGLLHREDGPALITYSASYWFINGRLHREGDEPAMVFSDQILMSWWKNGKRHRIDTPAVVHGGLDDEWWVNGVKYREETHFKLACRKYKLNNILNGKNSL